MSSPMQLHACEMRRGDVFVYGEVEEVLPSANPNKTDVRVADVGVFGIPNGRIFDVERGQS